MGTDALSSDESRAIARELAALSLEDAAPEELVLFPEISEDYFRDPDGVIKSQSRDEAVGFGLDIAMLTPFLLAVATPVVQFLVGVVEETAKEEAKMSVAGAVRRLFRRDLGVAAKPDTRSALSTEQARRVRQIAYEQARGLGVDEERADLLADSLVGRLLVA
jgi:hypothetical protein